MITLPSVKRRADAQSSSNSMVTVVLTATVDPKNIKFTERRDISVRLADYEQAARFWISDPAVAKIVFCENSGYDLGSIRKIFEEHKSPRKQVEILSFDGQDFEPDLGKGFGEMRILSHVLQNSRLLTSSDYIMKSTGRLYVKNAARLLRLIKNENTVDIYCNLLRNLTDADSRVFCCKRTFLERYLLPLAGICNDSAGINFESVLARSVHRAMAEGRRWSLMPVMPHIKGISATCNVKYSSNPFFWISREIFRKLKMAVLSH